ncbi:MAG: hypothetical protein ABJG78_05655 [Cyclobacteriaceae bacterium]
MDNSKEMDGMVLKGEIPQAVEKFFADNAQTKDVDGGVTNTKQEAIDKLTGFVGSIANVKEISLLRSASEGDVSMSEFLFNFDMKDGSEVKWHEVIRRVWGNGKVVNEQYFQN